MFLTFREEPDFLEATTGDSIMPLIKWFKRKLIEDAGIKVYHCLQQPWSKAICLDYLFYRRSGTTEEEKEYFAKGRNWAALLTAVACASVYCNVVQMGNLQTEPGVNWDQEKGSVMCVSMMQAGKRLRIDPMKPPSAAAFGQ